MPLFYNSYALIVMVVGYKTGTSHTIWLFCAKFHTLSLFIKIQTKGDAFCYNKVILTLAMVVLNTKNTSHGLLLTAWIHAHEAHELLSVSLTELIEVTFYR